MKRFIKSAIACIAAVAMVVTALPVAANAATKKTVTVTNQKQLDAAIKDGATKITIKTSKKVKITIPASKNAAKASIVVDAKNATITNKATVKGLTVKDAKAFTESGKNNDIKVTDTKLTLTVAKASKGADIQVAKTNANVKVVANGKVASITVAKKATIAITGKSNSMIDVKATAAGAKISTAVPASVTADKKATITIAKGADGSIVTANADVKVSVAKDAVVASVEVTAADAKVDVIAKGTISDVKVAESASGANLNITASGKVENVTVDAKADVAVAGTTTETVKVTVNAADTTVKAETAIDTTLNADAKVDLAAGAEGSKVTQGSSDVKVDVSNKTTDKVTVTDSTGKNTTVDAGKEQTTKPDSNKTENNNAAGSGSSSSSGSYYPSTPSTPSVPPTTYVVTSAALLTSALSSAKANDIIVIEGTITSGDAIYANYDVTKAVTIKAEDSATVNGTFSVYCDGVTLENLVISNRGGGSDKQKNAVNVVANSFTMKNCTLKLTNSGLDGGVANGLCIYPMATSTKYVLENNTFTGYNATTATDPKWTSTAILITEGYDLSDRFGLSGKKSATNVLIATGNDETAIATAQTYENVSLEYVHNDYSTFNETGAKYVYSYCVNGNTGAGKFSADANRTNKRMVLVNTSNENYAFEGEKDYGANTTIVFKSGNFTIPNGTVITCGAVVIEEQANITLGDSAVVNCNSFSNTYQNVDGNGKVVVGEETTYPGVIKATQIKDMQDVVSKAKSFDYPEVLDFLPMSNLTIDGSTVTATYNHDEWIQGIKYIYDFKKSDGKINEDGTITGANEQTKEAVAYSVDAFVMNTFARYLGAIYRCEDESHIVKSIKFNNGTYTWNTEKNRAGSNWEDTEGKTLVSAVTAACDSSIRTVEFDLVNENGISVKVEFKAVNVPKDLESVKSEVIPAES